MKSATPILMLLFGSMMISLLTLPFIPLARATPGPADYPITVHVRSSEWNANWLQLSVAIDGKNYLLSGLTMASWRPGTTKQSS